MTKMGCFIETLTKARKQIAPVCAAWAITANRPLRADFERLVNDFRSHLAAAGKPEGLLLAMHGGQAAEGADDAEGRRWSGGDRNTTWNAHTAVWDTSRPRSSASGPLRRPDPCYRRCSGGQGSAMNSLRSALTALRAVRTRLRRRRRGSPKCYVDPEFLGYDW